MDGMNFTYNFNWMGGEKGAEGVGDGVDMSQYSPLPKLKLFSENLDFGLESPKLKFLMEN